MSPNRSTILGRRLRQIAICLSAAFTFFTLCLWSWTSVIDSLRLSVWQPLDLSVNVQRGRMEWERTYALKGEIPSAQFHAAPIPPQRVVPRVQTFLGFGFSSGHERGYANYEPGSDPNRGVVRLADYWILVIPLWPILLLVSGPSVLWLIRWYRHPRRIKVGFELIAAERRPT
jgi:hypothetical protein